MPGAPWAMTQRWHDLLFAHWPLEPDVLHPRIPQGLTLDLFDGQAWVGGRPVSNEWPRLAVAVARRLYHLPYHHARINTVASGDWMEYHSDRSTSARFRARYRPTGGVRLAEPDTLEHWLTERYCLYTTDQQQTIGITLPDVPPLLHFAKRLDVFVWPLVPSTSPLL